MWREVTDTNGIRMRTFLNHFKAIKSCRLLEIEFRECQNSLVKVSQLRSFAA